ncbi:redoxin family protein [Maribacter algicola]|uniref:Redoxin family protein n=1 Tax=Meishania litoralis TaxID=3434685 RepID=A0ACC7LHK8_9FLAO
MKKKTLTPSNIIFAIFIVLLIIPQTRSVLQLAVNKVRVQLFSPSELDREDQTRLQPFSYELQDLKGKSTSIEIGFGNPVFISYWATWCPPCIAELPSIQELYEDYGNQVDFILLTNEDPDVVRGFLREKHYNLPVYSPLMAPPEKLYARSIPTNYVIDANGKILINETGATDWNSKKARAIFDALIRVGQK